MNQKIFNNILLIIVVIIFLMQISPEPNSTLYILKKYINYFKYKIKKNLTKFNLCQEEFMDIIFKIKNNKNSNFRSNYDIDYINYIKNNNPELNENEIYDFYYFIESLISKNKKNNYNKLNYKLSSNFNEKDIEKIKLIILKKLNSGKYKFDNFNFEYIPKYYIYTEGKYVDPFVFNVNSIYGKIRIYIDIDIKKDIYKNKEFFIINNIKPLKMKHVLFKNQNQIKQIKQIKEIKEIEQNNDIFINNEKTLNIDDISSEFDYTNIN
jgi:hypothetical protein